MGVIKSPSPRSLPIKGGEVFCLSLQTGRGANSGERLKRLREAVASEPEESGTRNKAFGKKFE